MSGGLDVLAMKEDDITKLLAAGVHLGDPNIDFQMSQYVFKVKNDGVPIINLRKTWEKLCLAARVVVAIENPSDVCVLSNKPYGQRAILKFAKYTGANAIAGRFTPGTFTNQIQAAFREPRLLIVSDPRSDHQSITEASYVNIPVIAFTNTNSPLRHIDIAIPCNNLGKNSLGLMWWLLCREVLRLRGTISRELPWEVMPDLFFYRDPEEVEKEEQSKAEEFTLVTGEKDAGGELADGFPSSAVEQWADTQGAATDWGAEVTTGAPPVIPGAQPVPATVPATVPSTTPAAAGGTGGFDQDWNVATTTTKDWGADDTGDWATTEPVSGGNW